MTLRDPEVLDLLSDDPTLLAVADAVAATQKAQRRPLVRRSAPRVVAVAVAAAAIVVLALVLPQGKHGIVSRAIAAIGDGRVMHIVVVMPTGTVDVDLQSGRRDVQQYRVEIWADRQQHRFRAVMSVDGRVVSDVLWPQDASGGGGSVDPAFAALWTGYREALEAGAATRAGEGDAFGHHVYWLRFKPVSANEPGTEVAVDAQTYLPVVYRVPNGSGHIDEHILLAESIGFTAADFARHGPAPSLGSTSAGSASSGPVAQGAAPSTTVPHGWLSAGPGAGGQQLAAVLPQRITTDGKTLQGIQLVYGDLDHGFPAPGATTIDELTAPDDPGAWAQIPAGAVRIEAGETSDAGGDHSVRTAYLAKDGRYVTITTRDGEDALLAIARSLRPVR